jgi:hypothetical protein
MFCFHHDIAAQKFVVKQDTILQRDTIPAGRKEKKLTRDPLKATMLAFAFPGLGQIYNRKYWKIPLVYAGFGSLVYAIGFNSTHYTDYMKAYQDFTDKIPETDSYTRFVRAMEPSEYDPVKFPKTATEANVAWVRDGLLKNVDYYKRYRDLSYIGLAAWYLISALDANVDASLFNYDISDNLDMSLAPMQIPSPGFIGAGLNVSFKVTF